MKIDFDKITTTNKLNFNGGEGVVILNMYKDDKNKIFKVTLNPGCSVGYHKHETSQEIMYLLQGEVLVKDDEEEYLLQPGQVHCCKRFHSHSITNKSEKPAILFCTVTNFE